VQNLRVVPVLILLSSSCTSW